MAVFNLLVLDSIWTGSQMDYRTGLMGPGPEGTLIEVTINIF